MYAEEELAHRGDPEIAVVMVSAKSVQNASTGVSELLRGSIGIPAVGSRDYRLALGRCLAELLRAPLLTALLTLSDFLHDPLKVL